MSSAPQRRRRPIPGDVPQPILPLSDPAGAWDQPLAPVTDLDDVARRYPSRKLTLEGERRPLEFYSSNAQPNAFSMDSLEFFLVVAQFFREALPLRLIFLLIACQRAGGKIYLTQEEMATVLDVTRTKINDVLAQLTEHGIVYRVRRGVYQFNPPYSYRLAEFIPSSDGRAPEYVKVEQGTVIGEIRGDSTLPDLVRFPSLEMMRTEIEKLRRERADARAEARRKRALEKGTGS